MYYHQHLRRPTATIHPRKKLYTPKLILPVRR